MKKLLTLLILSLMLAACGGNEPTETTEANADQMDTTSAEETCDTVLPGETSAEFGSTGPATGDEADMEPVEIGMLVLNEDGDMEYNVRYDVKLGTYTVVEMTP